MSCFYFLPRSSDWCWRRWRLHQMGYTGIIGLPCLTFLFNLFCLKQTLVSGARFITKAEIIVKILTIAFAFWSRVNVSSFLTAKFSEMSSFFENQNFKSWKYFSIIWYKLSITFLNDTDLVFPDFWSKSFFTVPTILTASWDEYWIDSKFSEFFEDVDKIVK